MKKFKGYAVVNLQGQLFSDPTAKRNAGRYWIYEKRPRLLRGDERIVAVEIRVIEKRRKRRLTTPLGKPK